MSYTLLMLSRICFGIGMLSFVMAVYSRMNWKSSLLGAKNNGKTNRNNQTVKSDYKEYKKIILINEMEV